VNAFHPHLLDRRLGMARTGVWIVLGILILSFFRTQILGHGKYQLQSETNRLRPNGVNQQGQEQEIRSNAIATQPAAHGELQQDE